jgi:hypothetical protein
MTKLSKAERLLRRSTSAANFISRSSAWMFCSCFPTNSMVMSAIVSPVSIARQPGDEVARLNHMGTAAGPRKTGDLAAQNPDQKSISRQ